MNDNARPTSRVAFFDEFLAAEEWRRLLDYTFSSASAFRETNVLSDDEDRLDHEMRRSLVLFELDGFRDLFAERLMAFLPQILTELDHPWFPVSQIEVQLTGTGDGEYFRTHTDDGSVGVSGRTVTFVYFFHREPCPFAGGELRIYDTVNDNGRTAPSGGWRSIYPAQNQVVFFPSYYLHEILPVSSPSGAFVDRRFTVNGWLHR
jgi:Rps23 Pro-64 3,4-dihydroxylase Tpa1-like proline 4-hydroxylase